MCVCVCGRGVSVCVVKDVALRCVVSCRWIPGKVLSCTGYDGQRLSTLDVDRGICCVRQAATKPNTGFILGCFLSLCADGHPTKVKQRCARKIGDATSFILRAPSVSVKCLSFGMRYFVRSQSSQSASLTSTWHLLVHRRSDASAPSHIVIRPSCLPGRFQHNTQHTSISFHILHS